MNIDSTKERKPLGKVLIALEEWQRLRLRLKLRALGVSQGQWKGLLTYAEAHKLPKFIRDAIVEELPDTADLFENPKLQPVS
ncbi:hypothetical protein [Dyadobacter diqingensis]|uniref:hypothetical protein n=1 Tax=Dyadobacter diqingensis TaxID=2938121 RepID=UPI0020C243CB|nr:hypothetical protein [Dyadobacter diqingensis]